MDRCFTKPLKAEIHMEVYQYHINTNPARTGVLRSGQSIHGTRERYTQQTMNTTHITSDLARLSSTRDTQSLVRTPQHTGAIVESDRMQKQPSRRALQLPD
ncbi:hypothetical protein BaRGS_00034045 [Batillaria attramentaria]|uniref:Uncharacterized protein n=1 Tax=Batillaria attramentaria TaxID=370345 RepID=A0ABD0JIC1_9CAEN